MSKPEDEILERELFKGGKLRSLLLFGFGGLLVDKLTQRWQPIERYEVTVGVPLNTDSVRSTTARILEGMGKVVKLNPGLPAESISVLVDTGFIDVSPTIVNVQFISTSEKSSQVVIRGLAKKGLLEKTQTAQKTVEKVKAKLLAQAANS
jgi:hypothetical protein